MLSFRALSEKKTKIKINPRLADISEMENNHGEDCDCMKCEKKRRKEGGEKEVATESKGYYDPMEDPDFDHDEAEATRGQSGKHAKKKKTTKKEETAYVSQEEVSEESNQESETETFLTFGQFIAEMPFQVMGSPDGKKERKIGKPVKSKKYADARAAELADTHKATGGKYRSQYVEEIELEEGIRSGLAAAGLAAAVAAHGGGGKKAEAPKSSTPEKSQAVQVSKKKETKSPEQIWREKHPNLAAREDSKKKPASVKSQLSDIGDMIARSKARQQQNNSFEPEGELLEGRAEDAKASLEKVKARQKVLDAHEKKTGKKLDITKTPEHKAHKQNFPGAKRQAKKVRGAKETPAEAHNRKVNTYMDRLKKYGKTTKQKRDDAAMAKHTSRFD